MFDHPNHPYFETLVREAIQNSLDARVDPAKPVSLNFTFHTENIGSRREYIEPLIRFRHESDLEIPKEWNNGQVRWMLIEDFNTHGLLGSREDRQSDFWHYWLNFGQSNKEGARRGGRGIGRTAFLIASQLNSIIGYTKRKDDQSVSICGMAALRADTVHGKFKSTHAFLAKNPNGSVYDLHRSPDFLERARHAFSFAGYNADFPSGLGIAVLFPYPDLKPNIILAAAIEHFAPSIIGRELALNVNSQVLNDETIDDIALKVSDGLRDPAIRADVRRFISIVRDTLNSGTLHKISVPNTKRNALEELRKNPKSERLQERITSGESVVFELEMPLIRNEKSSIVSLRGFVGPSSADRYPLDRLFRGGMSLPDVRATGPRDLDLLLFVGEGDLSEYLNLCEGKAHLDLLESKEISTQLNRKGFDGVQMKRFVKTLPTTLRRFFTPDAEEPDPHVFDIFFSKPKTDRKQNSGTTKSIAPTVKPPKARPAAFGVTPLRDGLTVVANPEYDGWPINISVRIAYADGTRRPSWNRLDFSLEKLCVESADCNLTFSGNVIHANACGPSTAISVRGFDINRELDTRISRIANA